MIEHAIEFVVTGVVLGEELLGEPYLTAVGRCGGLPVRRGDAFRYVVRVDEPEYPHGYESEPIELERRTVELTVRAIHSYGKERPLLDRGMTGALFLTGTGIDLVEPGHLLYGEGPTSVLTTNAVAEVGRT